MITMWGWNDEYGMVHDEISTDRRNPRLLGRDGRYHTYDELLPCAPEGVGAELDRAAGRAHRCPC